MAYAKHLEWKGKLSKALLGWKLIGDLSHYPTIILVDFDILIKVIMACYR
ncbi:hypothetical protein F383_16391 [Gossypium arboreum]|uniref:Uncharacterized protein n=1 Tax=Gossypium arboreum TaxID=29729 RepID=A0A0B0N7Q7_GOSAR|nr:hypothetical protein F383_16391 [Gossypium arboreum]